MEPYVLRIEDQDQYLLVDLKYDEDKDILFCKEEDYNTVYTFIYCNSAELYLRFVSLQELKNYVIKHKIESPKHVMQYLKDCNYKIDYMYFEIPIYSILLEAKNENSTN